MNTFVAWSVYWSKDIFLIIFFFLKYFLEDLNAVGEIRKARSEPGEN